MATSDLPLPWQAVAALLFALFLVNHSLHRKGAAMFALQSRIASDRVADEEKRWGWLLPFGSFVYATAIFLVALYAGGIIFTVLAGGLLVSVAFSVAHSARTVWHYRLLARQDAARGTLWMRDSTLIRAGGQVYLQGALFCLLAGLLLPHVALLGGALILGSAGFGLIRRARRAEAHL